MEATRCMNDHCNEPSTPGYVIAGKRLCRGCYEMIFKRQERAQWDHSIRKQGRAKRPEE